MRDEKHRSNEKMIKHYFNTMRWVSATREDKEDLAQDIRLRFWQVEQREGVGPDELSNALRYVICRDAMRDGLRGNSRHMDEHETFDLALHDHSAPPNALSQLLADELLPQIAFTDQEQGIAVLAFKVGMDQDDISDSLGLPTSTVNDAVRRMRKRAEELR